MLSRPLHAIALVGLLSAATAQPQTTTAITGARVIDGTGAPAIVETVVFHDNLIVAVSPHAEIPAGAHVIDASGQTLMPGLFDLHTHLNASGTDAPEDFGKSLKAYLVSGVTSVNDYSVYGEMIAPLRELMSNGTLAGPKVNFAIRFGTPQGHGAEFGWGDYFTQLVSTPAEAHAAMKKILVYKPDVIKAFTDGWRYGTRDDLTSMNLATLSAIVEDAHRAGIKVFTHTVTLNGAKIAARAGVDVLAHGVGDAPVDDDLIALLKKSGTGYVSTLATYEPPSNRAPSPHLLDLLAPGDRNFALRLVDPGGHAPPTEPVVRRWRFLQENIRRLSAAGVPIGVGTDAGVAATYHGWSTLHEMELLVDSGLTPMQAITAGTGTSARLVGESNRGTIAPGKVADLLLVAGSPDQTIGDIEQTSAVFLGGRQLDLAALRAAIQSPRFTPLPALPIPATIDDAEREDGRTNLDTMLVNSTDEGPDHSRILFTRTLRKHGHAISIIARMGPRQSPHADLDIPLTRGAVQSADLSPYRGIQFATRGDGSYIVLLDSYGTHRSSWPAASFAGKAKWKTIRIPFSAFQAKGSPPALPLQNVRALRFELARPAGADAWLEIDDVKLF